MSFGWIYRSWRLHHVVNFYKFKKELKGKFLYYQINGMLYKGYVINMRIDIVLKKLGIIKTREAVKKGCHSNKILVNGKYAKPSTEIKIGALIDLHFHDRQMCLKILKLPQGNVSKKQRADYYEVENEMRIQSEDSPVIFTEFNSKNNENC
jgi:ribosomal 50S subunit-recycling heat shock protein